MPERQHLAYLAAPAANEALVGSQLMLVMFAKTKSGSITCQIDGGIITGRSSQKRVIAGSVLSRKRLTPAFVSR